MAPLPEQDTGSRDSRYTAPSGAEGKGTTAFEPELTPKLCSQPFGRVLARVENEAPTPEEGEAVLWGERT